MPLIVFELYKGPVCEGISVDAALWTLKLDFSIDYKKV